MTIKQLQDDRQAEFFTTPYIDAVRYTGHKIIGMYHDIDDKAIVQRNDGKISLNKLYYSDYREEYFFIKDKRRYFLNEFLPINY
jgi:hypothetical protein